MDKKAKFDIPKEVQSIALVLVDNGFEAYIVGGCVRDILLGQEPKDWDIATNATPDKVQELFSKWQGAMPDKPATVYENDFGTVGIKTKSEDPRLKIIEVTTFRSEEGYADKRHPDHITFAKTIEEDLARRDFTVNAMAMGGVKLVAGEIVDIFRGQDDLTNKIIRSVGRPEERFAEDALRMMRAVRFAVELDDFSAGGGPASGWQIDPATHKAIEAHSRELEFISKERIRDEFIKIIETPRAAKGIMLLEELNLLNYVLPELRHGIGVGQNKHHIYSVFEHSVRALDYSAKENHALHVRLAALLHDVGKPKAKRGEGPDSTFYGHEVVGAKMAAKALDRLRFPKDLAEKVIHLIRYHMFYYNTDEVSAAGVRRFLARVGPENVGDLMKVREADRIGSGVPKAVPYKSRHLLFMIEKVKSDPISAKMLKVNGEDVMRILKIEPGPKVGQILAVLLEEVLDDPTKNTEDKLTTRTKELGKFTEKELIALAKKAKEKKDEFEEGVEKDMKKKYYVK